MGKILHVLNGSGIKSKFETAFPGETCITWDEALIEGPPLKMGQLEQSLQKRSQYLQGKYKVKPSEYIKSLKLKLKSLRQWDGDEIVLWFEFDLFCLFNLGFLLGYIQTHTLQQGKVTLVIPKDKSAYPTLSSLKASDLHRYFKKRKPIDAPLFSDAKSFYPASGKPKNRAYKSALFKKAAGLYNRFLKEEPNGLNRLDIEILKAIQRGSRTKQQVFQKIWKGKSTKYLGLGDSQLEGMLDALSNTNPPRLAMDKAGELSLTTYGLETLKSPR